MNPCHPQKPGNESEQVSILQCSDARALVLLAKRSALAIHESSIVEPDWRAGNLHSADSMPGLLGVTAEPLAKRLVSVRNVAAGWRPVATDRKRNAGWRLSAAKATICVYSCRNGSEKECRR